MAKKEEKRSFVMYDSFLEAMKHLNDAEFRECVLKIRDYALEGNEEESASPMVNVIMALAKPNLDSAKRRYMASVENGKKGAEFGKLGGAPKGNQNARKKQPLKQPLDVDVDDNVNEDVNDYEDADVNADCQSTLIGLKSSFSSSIEGVNNQIENDSEQFEDREEKIEPRQEVNSSQSNSCDVRAAGKNTSEALSSNAEVSSATPQRREEGGVDMGEYLERVIANSIGRLAKMKQQGKELDKGLINSTIDNIIAQYGHHDRRSAYSVIMKGIDRMIAANLI